MNRQGVSTSVLSLLGSFCWIEAQPLDVSLALCRLFNDSVSRLCQEHEGRFAAYAALPLVDISAAAVEVEPALGLAVIVGTQRNANPFLRAKLPMTCVPCSRARNGTAQPSSATTVPRR